MDSSDSRNSNLSFFLPFILGISSSSRRDEQEEVNDQNQETERTQDRILLINPLTQSMVVIQSFDSLFSEVSEKNGLPPASKTSIDAMPKIEITEEIKDMECSICLDGWEIGGEAREMPCKHKFHSNCIEKWLGIHGSCPVCRFEMPIDDNELCKKRSNGGGEEERERRGERGVLVSFSFSRRNSSSAYSDSSSQGTENGGSGSVFDGSSSNNQPS